MTDVPALFFYVSTAKTFWRKAGLRAMTNKTKPAPGDSTLNYLRPGLFARQIATLRNYSSLKSGQSL